MLSIYFSLSCSGKKGATNRYSASLVEFKKQSVSNETFFLQLDGFDGYDDDIMINVSLNYI